MGFLGQILGSVLSSSGPQSNEAAALEGVVQLIQHPSVGGVAGLVSKFQGAGLGQIAQGWVSNGPNPPVTAAQITQVIGQQRIAEFAQKLGIPPDQAVQHLAQLLPHVIDHLTPNGVAPTGQTAEAEVFNLLKSKFL